MGMELLPKRQAKGWSRVTCLDRIQVVSYWIQDPGGA